MIPIYRAFSETFDKYILGVPYFSDGKYYMLVDDCNKNDNVGTGSFPIEPTTLAIHFPDMLDSQGNKIFASLSKDGKGGDICYVRDFSYGDLQGVARYEDNYFRVYRKGKAMGVSLKCRDIKIIGIQQ